MTSEAAKIASERWLTKTVAWSVKISNESYPYEAEMLEDLKREKGLVAELFRGMLLELTEDQIDTARAKIEVL